ncbi:MAG: hypothetical protein IKG82_11300 [Oscillospiraceae bacterium]|nr:hypothetical protein [Oscillospiraceae bacterium]
MRSYEETIRNVHSRIALYEQEQKMKRGRIAGAAAAVTPVCLAAAAGIVLWKSGAFAPADMRQVSEPAVTPVTETVPSGTLPQLTAAAKNPGASGKQQTAAEPDPGSPSADGRADAGTKPAEAPANSTDPPAEAAVSPADTPQSNVTAVTAEKTAPVTKAGSRTITTAKTAPVTAAETRAVTEPAKTETVPAKTTAAAGNGPYLREGDEPPVYRNLITSYPIGCSADYRAPYDGEVCYTVPLFYAMQEYGADADYMVIIDLYSGAGTANSKRLYELSDLRAEFDRLGELGYEAGLNQPSNAAPFLTLHATYEELQNFPAAADRGYFLRLYLEDEPSCIPGAYNE